MKRLILAGLVLVTAILLSYGGNRIVASVVDAQLPGLLSRELGIKVSLEPARVSVATLTVQSPRLLMGDPANPALVATRVSVSLAWSDLLHGEIRLRQASGEALVVNPSLWPGNDNPWPVEYRFLDPYLADEIALESATYVAADGASHKFQQPRWQRTGQGASLSWQESSAGRTIGISAVLASLDDLLRLAKVQLQLTATPAGNADSALQAAITLQPGEESGYRLAIDIDAAGTTAQVVSGNSRNWELPDQSSTTIRQLDIARLQALARVYRGKSRGDDSASQSTAALPRLLLPVHQGRVSIDEIRWRGEVATDTRFDFNTGPGAVTVPALSSRGPAGSLQGQLQLADSAAGWQLELTAAIQAAATDAGAAAPFLESDWIWRQGSARISGRGATWNDLLNALQGDIALGGFHRGAVETPVNITARLDNHPGKFALEAIDVEFARGRITGSAELSGTDRKLLRARVRAEHLNLDPLLPPAGPAGSPGVELPRYLAALPGVDLDWELELDNLSFGTANIEQGSLSFQRAAQQADLAAAIGDGGGGKLNLRLAARMAPDSPTAVDLDMDLTRLSFARLLGHQPLLADSRVTGSIKFSSSGTDMEQVFAALKGVAELSIDHRPDRDWKRPPVPEQQFRISGESTLVLQEDRITGLQIGRLAVASPAQDLSGTVSLVEGRKPWLIADLTASRLDLDSLRDRGAADLSDKPKSDPLESLRQLGESRISLQAKSVLLADLPLSDLALRVTTAPAHIGIEQVNFSLDEGSLAGRGELGLAKDQASFSLEARVTDLPLDKILENVPATARIPLSGSVDLRSSGNTLMALLGNLRGDILLTTGTGKGHAASTPAGTIDLSVRETAQGMHTDVRRFQWQGTDLAGSLEYQATKPLLLQVEISGGTLSLLPWETEEGPGPADKGKADTSPINSTARAGIGLLGDIVMAPLRLIAGPREAASGAKLFSDTPLPLDWLQQHEARVKGRLDKLITREAAAEDVEFTASLLRGVLDIEAAAGSINGGHAAARLSLDALQQDPSVALSGSFTGVHGELIEAGLPRSGYFDVTSTGRSQAELAGNVNGLVYLEVGAGPLDYSKMMLLTADVASKVFESLIPGIDKAQPQLECAVTLGVFKDGIGSTPYGYAARTNQANLVGKVELNLKKELIRLNFSSSSRKGLGFSIGNVFSNTVAVEGPLTNPKIIPNATGLLWRSWAAVMTGGLSVLGESVLKRALASEDPCVAVQTHIRKDICGTGQPAAASALVCPPT